MGALTEEGFLRLPEIIGDRRRGVVGVFPVSRSSWYQGVAAGRYPAPVKHGAVSFWRAADIRVLLEQVAAQGRAA